MENFNSKSFSLFVSESLSSKKNSVMKGHLCAKTTCLKYCMRVSGWWRLRTISTVVFLRVMADSFPLRSAYHLSRNVVSLFWKKLRRFSPFQPIFFLSSVFSFYSTAIKDETWRDQWREKNYFVDKKQNDQYHCLKRPCESSGIRGK